MTISPSNVVRIKDYLPPPPPRQKSQYELYPLPFFDAERRSTWEVRPTGSYSADYETGRAYAVKFLESCDGTVGWSSLLANVVADMIGAGAGTWPDGSARINGVVVGFMQTIGRQLAAVTLLERGLRS